MRTYCEIFVRDVLPAIRAGIIEELLREGFTQEEAAKKLGLRQPTVANYLKRFRAKHADTIKKKRKMQKLIKKTAQKLIERKDPQKINLEICCICNEIKKSKLVCEFHKKDSPELCICELCEKIL